MQPQARTAVIAEKARAQATNGFYHTAVRQVNAIGGKVALFHANFLWSSWSLSQNSSIVSSCDTPEIKRFLTHPVWALH